MGECLGKRRWVTMSRRGKEKLRERFGEYTCEEEGGFYHGRIISDFFRFPSSSVCLYPVPLFVRNA